MWEAPLDSIVQIGDNELKVVAKSQLTQDVLLLSEPIRIAGFFDAKPTPDSKSWILSQVIIPNRSTNLIYVWKGFQIISGKWIIL